MSSSSRFVIVTSVIVVFVVMVMPILLYQTQYATIPEHHTKAAATTVALGAVFRSNSRNFLKSTFMSAIRTALRTWIRRMIRLALPILIRVFLPLLKSKKKESEQKNQPLSQALVLGFVALWFSFYGVILLSKSESVLFGFSVFVCASVAAFCYILHFIMLFISAQKYTTTVSVKTSIEGILLQGYFTGALSYLPLSSDFYIEGTDKSRAQTILHSFLSMIALSLGLDLVGSFFSIPILQMLGAHILLYCFVISFPLNPLDGNGLYRYNKWLWLTVFSFTMLCFLLNMPEAFYGVL